MVLPWVTLLVMVFCVAGCRY